MMHGCLQGVNSSGGIKGKTQAKLLIGLMNYGLKFWYIKEIGNTLTTSCIVSSAVCG